MKSASIDLDSPNCHKSAASRLLKTQASTWNRNTQLPELRNCYLNPQVPCRALGRLIVLWVAVNAAWESYRLRSDVRRACPTAVFPIRPEHGRGSLLPPTLADIPFLSGWKQ